MAEVRSITSIKDPHVLEARALTSAAGRRQAQKALLEGEESLTWALEAGFPLEYVLFHDRIGQHPLLDLLRDRGVECFSASERQQLMDYLRRIQANCERMIEA